MRAWGIAEHAATMGVELSNEAVDQLHDLIRLLAKWNRVYNLTSVKGEDQWVSHHLLDSLAISPLVPRGRLLDVGSGGGFPGLPLAVADPQRAVVLLDSNSKKTSFLRQAVSELGLANVAVQTGRVETFAPAALFDVVVSRAFSDLDTFVRLAGPLCKPGGRLMAMKGVYPETELAEVSSACVERVIRLQVPTLDAERHVVLIDPSADDKG